MAPANPAYAIQTIHPTQALSHVSSSGTILDPAPFIGSMTVP